MTDAHLMEADCIHGEVWYDCGKCVDPDYPDVDPVTGDEAETEGT